MFRTATTPRVVTTALLAAGLTCTGITLAGSRATAARLVGQCYHDPGQGAYQQSAVFPGAGKAVWTMSVDINASDNCEGTDEAEVNLTIAPRRNAGPRSATVSVEKPQFTVDGTHWIDLPAKPDCFAIGCDYHGTYKVGQHRKVRQVRETTYIVAGGKRSRGLTFTCRTQMGKCSTG